MVFSRRRIWGYILVAGLVFLFFHSGRQFDTYGSLRWYTGGGTSDGTNAAGNESGLTKWSRVYKARYPVESMRSLPTGKPLALPKVQHAFGKETAIARDKRRHRQDAVRETFRRCWTSYRERAWMSDELTPVSGGKRDTFGGWGATLVDGLDTLWIMDMKEEFNEAVEAAVKIDFEKTTSREINVFETTIRYLGGFLAAYELSGDERLLNKAREVGEMLYVAFDTPNHMPITRWNAKAAAGGYSQIADDHVLLAEIGTFSLEFTRLSMLTGDARWFDASQRIIDLMKEQQSSSRIPGMWPVVVDARKQVFNDEVDHTLGAMADSLYEYLPKTYALTGGLLPVYRQMYVDAMDAAMKHNLFRPMLPNDPDILLSGLVTARKEGSELVTTLRPEGQHLACFIGGMFALGGRLVKNDTHVEKGEKLMDGCVWAYQSMPLGIMPETFYVVPCENPSDCPWDENTWRQAILQKAGLNIDSDADKADHLIAEKRLPKGFVSIPDTRYILRPEAIESVFILYRTTGREDLPDKAWKMFEAIEKHTKTELANSALDDITVIDEAVPKSDSMESFWLGETLKYFYLTFSEPDLISLDEYVFNTEAHPLKRLLP